MKLERYRQFGFYNAWVDGDTGVPLFLFNLTIGKGEWRGFWLNVAFLGIGLRIERMTYTSQVTT